MDKFSIDDMEDSLVVNVEAKRKKDTEFWKTNDPKFEELLKLSQKNKIDTEDPKN